MFNLNGEKIIQSDLVRLIGMSNSWATEYRKKLGKNNLLKLVKEKMAKQQAL